MEQKKRGSKGLVVFDEMIITIFFSEVNQYSLEFQFSLSHANPKKFLSRRERVLMLDYPGKPQ